MLAIDLFVGPPFGMLCYEGVLATDDLTLEVRRQTGVVFGQSCGVSVFPFYHWVVLNCRTFNAQIAAHEGLAHIDVLYLDFDFILLAI